MTLTGRVSVCALKLLLFSPLPYKFGLAIFPL